MVGNKILYSINDNKYYGFVVAEYLTNGYTCYMVKRDGNDSISFDHVDPHKIIKFADS